MTTDAPDTDLADELEDARNRWMTICKLWQDKKLDMVDELRVYNFDGRAMSLDLEFGREVMTPVLVLDIAARGADGNTVDHVFAVPLPTLLALVHTAVDRLVVSSNMAGFEDQRMDVASTITGVDMADYDEEQP